MIENEIFLYITQEDEERERVEQKRDRRKGKWETSQDVWDENRERIKKSTKVETVEGKEKSTKAESLKICICLAKLNDSRNK